MRPNDQIVLITGGGSGIGLEIAKVFLANQNTVIITGRNLSKLEAVQQAYPAIHIVQSDVTSEEDVKTLASKLEREVGGIDVLVNNAGIMNLVDVGNETNELPRQFQEIEINFHGPIRMLHHFLPQLKRSKQAVLVNVSSGLAYVPFAQAPVYSGTKSALHGWTQAIRPQLKPHGIKVVELLPPVVDTDLAKEADVEASNLKPMAPEKMAAIFWKGYINGKEDITPGISLALKLMSRVAPRLMFNQLNKQPIPQS
jgi:uncharacterized oxidoreductase